MIRIILFFIIITLIPRLVFAQSSVEYGITLILYILIISPYYLAGWVLNFFHRKYEGKPFSISLITYLACVAGILIAYYQEYKFDLPDFNDEEDLVFFFKALPFIIVIILVASRDKNAKIYG